MMLSLLVMSARERRVIGSILLGTAICLGISEINLIIYGKLKVDMLYFTSNVSPVTEEIIKAIPVVIYAFVFSDDRQKLITVSFAIGLGFAIMENMILFTQNIKDINITWAIIRGFGAGLMHSVCTVAVGIGISFVKARKKLFYCGTTALLMMAITYHAIYNTIALSAYRFYGVLLPMLTYIPILITFIKKKNRKNSEKRTVSYD